MARRFQGQFSPSAKGQPSGEIALSAPRLAHYANLTRRLRRYRFLSYPIMVASIFAFLGGHPFGALITLGGGAAIFLVAEITKAGLEAEAAYEARAIARRPAWPRKTIGALLMGAIVGGLSYVNTDAGMLGGIGAGAFATVGMLLSFGFDPMKNKGITAQNEYVVGRANEAIERAEAVTADIRAMMPALSDRRVELEVENLLISVNEVLGDIEDDPRDYRNARRYLGVYLKGARDATAQYVEVVRIGEDASAKTSYLDLIRELEAGFRNKRQLMLEDNRSALDVEIEVLRDRLASEGITVTKEDDDEK